MIESMRHRVTPVEDDPKALEEALEKITADAGKVTFVFWRDANVIRMTATGTTTAQAGYIVISEHGIA